MSNNTCPLLLVLIASLTTLGGATGAGPIFVEKGGIVAIEAESTASRLGEWVKKTDVSGFSGGCHLEFTGNKAENGPPKSPLKYQFKIGKAGAYTLTIRARKRLESKRQDISNDCYVALDGDFSSGGKAPLKFLQTDTKMFGGNADDWGWTNSLDRDHKKFPAVYTLKPGELYTLTISGRSKNFNIDRFLLVHESKDLRKARNANPAESEVAAGVTLPEERAQRELTSKDGRKIDAELIGKEGETLKVLVGGKLYKIPITSLSEADQQFLRDWEP